MLLTTTFAPIALALVPQTSGDTPSRDVQAADRKGQVAAPVTHVALAARIGSSLVDREKAPLGVLEDVVVAREGGRVTHAIVSVDGRRSVVSDPLALFQWDAEEDRWQVPIAASEAAAWEAFPEDGLEGLSSSMSASKTSGRAVDASARELPPPLFLATELLGTPVALTGDPFGSVTDLVLALGRRSVEFVVVSADTAPSEDPPVAPWGAVSAEAEGRLVLNLGRLAIEEAPRLEGGNTRLLQDPEFRSEIYAFYGVREGSGAKPAKARQESSVRN